MANEWVIVTAIVAPESGLLSPPESEAPRGSAPHPDQSGAPRKAQHWHSWGPQ